MKTGLIYPANTNGHEVEVSRVIRQLKILAKTLRWAGGTMMAVAFVGLIFIYLPLGIAEIKYAWNQTMTGKEIARIDRNIAISRLEEKKLITSGENKPDWVIPDENYSIYIPKIEAKSRVIPGVNAYDKNDYMAALRKGVAEASGLSHPGEMGTTYLFAHSVGNRFDYARYNAVFYLLDKLSVGDDVEIYYQNKLYKYRVWKREITEPQDVSHLEPQNAEEKLVLQTCYPPGTTWKRLIITAKRI